jgi:hypothetical protein
VTFTVTQSGGASGFTASGSGNINNTVAMPSGANITYKAKAEMSSSATGTLSDTATVTAPSGVSDSESRQQQCDPIPIRCRFLNKWLPLYVPLVLFGLNFKMAACV